MKLVPIHEQTLYIFCIPFLNSTVVRYVNLLVEFSLLRSKKKSKLKLLEGNLRLHERN